MAIVMLGEAAVQVPPAEQLRLFRQVFGAAIGEGVSELLDTYDALKAKKFRGSKENIQLLRLEKLIARMWEQVPRPGW
jgi:hypothetical protein